MEAISIVVTDDHPAVLHGVVDVLKSNSDMNVVAACTSGTAALRAIRELAPTVAVVDILMPGLNGLDLVASISAERCPTNVVVLTATASEEQLTRHSPSLFSVFGVLPQAVSGCHRI